MAFRFIAANDHPDHDTIASFRGRFLKEIETLFVEVLVLARETVVLAEAADQAGVPDGHVGARGAGAAQGPLG